MRDALRALDTMPSIRTVILAAAYADYPRALKGASFTTGLESMLDVLQASGRRIVLLEQVPVLAFDPKECVVRPFVAPRQPDCRVPRAYSDSVAAESDSLVAGVLRRHPGVVVIDPRIALCDAQFCRASVDGRLLYADDNHLNARGSDFVAAALSVPLARAVGRPQE